MPTHSTTDILAALKAEGIDCAEHELGLAAYAVDPVAYVRALTLCRPEQPAKPAPSRRRPCGGYANCCNCPDCRTRAEANTRLRVVTMPQDAPPLDNAPPCEDDPMVCTCPQHAAERVTALRRGPQGAGPAAFTVRPARLRRAA